MNLSSKLNLIPLNYKLVLTVLTPLLALILFFVQIEAQKKESMETTSRLVERISMGVAIERVVDALQQERRASIRKIAHDRQYSDADLQNAQLRSNSALSALDSFRTKGLVADYQRYAFIDQIPDWRLQVAEERIGFKSLYNNYQKVAERLKSYLQSDQTFEKRSDAFGATLQANTDLSNLIDHFIAMRLSTYLHYVDPKGSALDLDEYRLHYDLYDSYKRSLTSALSSEDARTLFENSSFEASDALFASILRTQGVRETMPSEEWWEITAAGLTSLRQQQRIISEHINQEISAIKLDELRDLNQGRIVLLACLAVTLITILLVTRSIAVHLDELQKLAAKIALGHTNLVFPLFAKDALGAVASSIKSIDRNNQKLSFAATKIGDNNFDVEIEPRGEHDAIGNALQRMRDSLHRHAILDQRELWIQAGLSSITRIIIENRQLDALCQAVLNEMAHYLEASVGAFYVSLREDRLTLKSGIGLTEADQINKELSVSEGLLGKSIQENRLLLVTELPENFLRISSGLGSGKPNWVLIIPLIHEDVLHGAIELASFSPAHEAILDLSRQVASNISAALHAVKSRMQLKELLEETQAQSEELQAQHSELENLNVELEAQAQRLQASEEELRVQQEELLDANQELEIRSQSLEEKNQLILERNLEIQRKARELEQSTRYKSEFLANMSHELRTPLNSILLLSHLLSENKQGNLSGEQVESAQVIQNSGNGLLALIDEILDLSKIESGKMVLELQETTFKEITDELKGLFLPLAKDKNLFLNLEIDTEVPGSFQTDSLRLQQILRNLLSNALKFTSKGGVTLRISLEPGQHGTVRFSVLDTGIGIPEDKQRLIFEAFQQADGSTRRQFGGTGLGLSISRELAKLLHGSLQVSSAPGKGSEFYLLLPLQPNQADKVVNRKHESLIHEQKKELGLEDMFAADPYVTDKIPDGMEDDRTALNPGDPCILIVEDDIRFAKALMDYAHQEGYRVIAAVRGDHALPLAERYEPKAILLDIELPVMSGWTVMESLKKNPKTRHIPVHIMSSHEVKRESISKGAIDFVRKPLMLEHLSHVFKRIEKALSGNSGRVLIVEENLKHAEALASYLESFQIKTDIRGDIHSAIESLTNQDANCVILDMGMPDDTAYEALEQIKSASGMESLPVIIFTGKNLSPTEERKIKQYADSIVVKTAHSYERIIDEVGLFLHMVHENETPEQQPKKFKLPMSGSDTLAGKRVLIADDDIRNIFSLTKVLEQYQMTVFSATTGAEALKHLQSSGEAVDVVLMDMMMPEMDGYETIRRIRKLKPFEKLPILAVTAKAMVGDREKCIAAGASDYISKPVDVNQLLSLLRVWLYK